MAALPYMQLYVADYLADTMHLTTEEHGAYLLLIFNYWQTGKSIPKPRLARIARLSNDRWTDVERSLQEFFTDDGEDWVHTRIERDLDAVYASQNQRSEAGKASAAARKAKKDQALKRKSNARSTTVENPLNENPTIRDTDTDTEETPPPRAQDGFDSRAKFAMTEDWQPDEKSFAAVLTMNALGNQVFDQDQFLEFKSFWIASPDDHRTQAKWEHALAQHLKRNLRNDQAAGRTTDGHQGAELPRNPQNQTGRGPEGRNVGPGRTGPLSAPDRVRAAIAERDAAAGAAGQAVDQNG